MKYYIYVSDAKVDMLYAQIPSRLRDKIATELKIDLKFISATFKEPEAEYTQYSKLSMIEKFLQKDKVIGTVDDPTDYFYGNMNFRWGLVGGALPVPRETIVFWGGATNQTILGLGGSPHHIVGNASKEMGYLDSGLGRSQANMLIATLRGVVYPDSPYPIRNDLAIVAMAAKTVKGPLQKFEFLAKYFMSGKDKNGREILLGSPIYVALSA
jgi:hypothetical protein